MTASATSPPRPRRTATDHGWPWLAPRLAIAVFVLALAALLWVLHRQELDDQQAAVIRDILWVEQNVRFSLARDVEQLAQLGEDAGDLERRQVELRMEYLLQNSPGLLQVAVLDEQGRVRASALPVRPEDGARWSGASALHELARSSGNAAWGPPYRADQEEQLDVFVPYYRAGRPAGTVVGVYGLRTMLAALVPWWLAERHLVTFRDAGGAVVAAKSAVSPRETELSHQVALDPPGQGLHLHLASYGGETQLLRNVLTAVIVVLAGAVLWNLWALRRHVRRRLATEEALRAEHAFRKAMEDSLHTGMRVVDLEGRIAYVNPAFCNMVGWSEQELVGARGPLPYWPPEEREHIERALRQSRERGAPSAEGIELKLVRRSGEPFDALLYEAPLIDAQGRQTGWLGSFLDITERKRARELARQQEEKLAATARLVTMGEMASAIAHELNQPLSAIASYTTGCLNLLAGGAPDRAELEDALRKSAQQTQRAGRIIRRVHEFVRKSEPARTAVRMSAVVEEAVGFAEADARKRGVRIQPRLARGDPEFQGDRVLLQQVVLNLVRNAVDAMADTPADERELVVATEVADGAVTVSISDRGCGIDPARQDRLFEPFFTTKAEGMGIGLNICRSIVELHRGRLWAEPNPGGGAVFSFSLPVAHG